MTVRSIGRALLRYWYVVIAVTLVFAVIAGAVASTESVSYSAQTLVYAPSAAAPLNANPVILDRQLVTTVELLNAEEIPSGVLDDADLDLEADEAAARVTVTQVTDADVMVVSATATTPEAAESLSRAAAEHYASVINKESDERRERLGRYLASEEASVALSGTDALALSLLEEESRVIGETSVGGGGGTSVAQSAVLGAVVGFLFGVAAAVALGYLRVPSDSISEMEGLSHLTVLGRIDENATTPREAGAPDAYLELVGTALLEHAASTGHTLVTLLPAHRAIDVRELAQDLARGIAAQGRDAALIDASSISDDNGFAQLAEADTSLDDIAESLAVGDGHVWMLGPGRTGVPFESWLGSEPATRATTKLAERCAMTLMVAPPLGKDASGLLMASRTDAVALVVAETMARSAVERASEDIRRADIGFAQILIVAG